MQASLQKKTRIKILPAISFKENLRLRGTDIDEAVKNVQGVLPDNADEDTQVTITLLEKNLQTIADPGLYEGSLNSSGQECNAWLRRVPSDDQSCQF